MNLWVINYRFQGDLEGMSSWLDKTLSLARQSEISSMKNFILNREFFYIHEHITNLGWSLSKKKKKINFLHFKSENIRITWLAKTHLYSSSFGIQLSQGQNVEDRSQATSMEFQEIKEYNWLEIAIGLDLSWSDHMLIGETCWCS